MWKEKQLLEKMYKEKRGVLSGDRVFYPRKVRSCKNCMFEDFDLHTMKHKGCTLFLDGDKPEICIPVRYEGSLSEIHADRVSTWVLENLYSNKKEAGNRAGK